MSQITDKCHLSQAGDGCFHQLAPLSLLPSVSFSLLVSHSRPMYTIWLQPYVPIHVIRFYWYRTQKPTTDNPISSFFQPNFLSGSAGRLGSKALSCLTYSVLLNLILLKPDSLSLGYNRIIYDSRVETVIADKVIKVNKVFFKHRRQIGLLNISLDLPVIVFCLSYSGCRR